MAAEQRDAFDLALVVLALALVAASSIDASKPVSIVGAAVAAVTSLNPIVYLVLLGVAGILFMTYLVLYLPSSQRR